MKPPGGNGPWIFLAVIVIAFFGFLSEATQTLGPEGGTVVWIATAISLAVVLCGPVGKALARHFLPDASATPALPDELVREIDVMRQRMHELEERADFAERLLIKEKTREPA